jgi:hypothetical protein
LFTYNPDETGIRPDIRAVVRYNCRSFCLGALYGAAGITRSEPAKVSVTQNPLAPQTLPWFVRAPGGTDVLYVITMLLVIVSVVSL